MVVAKLGSLFRADASSLSVSNVDGEELTKFAIAVDKSDCVGQFDKLMDKVFVAEFSDNGEVAVSFN